LVNPINAMRTEGDALGAFIIGLTLVLRGEAGEEWPEGKAQAMPGMRLNAGTKCDLTRGRQKSAEF
jgi:hypothetical protein